MLPCCCCCLLPKAKLLQRFCQITHRRAWRHRFLLPSHALARAYMLAGDDSRLRTFVRKLVLGGWGLVQRAQRATGPNRKAFPEVPTPRLHSHPSASLPALLPAGWSLYLTFKLLSMHCYIPMVIKKGSSLKWLESDP